ncbi:MAG: DegT/DnrJ/EryC1/StrS family aminotransferase [Chitinophagaceae bacterium]|nr:MAG: DegT/DnrJ/EryC1/StrS family aminotransferase [Chitinophagaceae bacterium]
MNIPVYNTFIHPDAGKYVQDVVESTFLSEGKLVKDFESRLRFDFKIENPVAVNSGTSALHLALVLAGIGENDEIILPAQTFVASGLVILQQKAKPVFADIDYHTGNISPEAIERKITARTKAIMPVHWGGYPCDMDAIQRIADKHNLIVIEDAAHALGARYKGKTIGGLSDFTCFSFQAIKHLTTGDGGAIACKDDRMYKNAIIRRWFGIDRDNATPSFLGERQYSIQDVGFKYHLNDYAAALGLANMQGFKERMKERVQHASRYTAGLKNIPGISLFSYREDCQSAYWLYGFHVERREDFIRALKERGVIASVIHQRIDRNEVFGGLKNDLTEQARFDATQIHIPIHDAMTDEKVEHVIESIRRGW